VESRKSAITYDDYVSDCVSNHEGAKTTSKATNEGVTVVDGDDELGANESGARVVVAVVELENGGVALVVEVVEGVLDFGIGPLRNDVGYSAGEGHSTGSEDSKDGREAHDEEAWEGYFG